MATSPSPVKASRDRQTSGSDESQRTPITARHLPGGSARHHGHSRYWPARAGRPAGAAARPADRVIPARTGVDPPAGHGEPRRQQSLRRRQLRHRGAARAPVRPAHVLPLTPTRQEADATEWCNEILGASETASGGGAVGAMVGGRGCVEALGGDEYLLTVAWQGLAPDFGAARRASPAARTTTTAVQARSASMISAAAS